MEGIIRVETIMTYEDLKHFTWYSILKKGKQFKPIFYGMIASFVIGLAGVIFGIWHYGLDGFWDSPVFSYAFALLIIPFMFFLIISYSIKKGYKVSKPQLDVIQRYEFLEDGVHAESTAANVTGQTLHQYGAYLRVVEVEDAFYLFVTAALAQVIAKRNLDEAGVKSLAGLLREKVGEKYIKCF